MNFGALCHVLISEAPIAMLQYSLMLVLLFYNLTGDNIFEISSLKGALVGNRNAYFGNS